MNFLQQIRDWFKPTTIKCADDLETKYEARNMQDQYEAHIPEKRHKVPIFQQLMGPVLMVTLNPELIKGFRFEFGVPLSQYFVTSYAWNIPNSGTVEEAPNPMAMQVQQKPTFTFTTQLVQDIRGQQPYTIMLGKADNEGKVDAIFVRKLAKNLSLKLNASFLNSNVEQGAVSAELELQGKDSMSVFKYGPGMWGFSYNQRLHRNLLMGFQYNNLTAQKISLMSYGLKAFINKHSLFANYVAYQQQYNLGYIIPILKGTHFVAHYRYDSHERSPTTILGFKQTYDQSQILATVNTKYEISTTISLRTPAYAIKLCALVDYMKEKYSFGYGITIGQAV